MLTSKRTALFTCLSLVGTAACGGSASKPADDLALASVRSALTAPDCTPTSAADVWVASGTSLAASGIEALLDTDPGTFLWVPGEGNQITYKLARPTVVTSYELAPGPRTGLPTAWKLEGSVDGADNWTLLASATDQVLVPGGPKKEASFSNTIPFLWVRLTITKVDTQVAGKPVAPVNLASFRVGGSAPSGLVPSQPTLQAVLDSNTVHLTFSASNATSYAIRRYAVDGTLRGPETLVTDTSRTESDLIPGTAYVYTVQGINGNLRGFPSQIRVLPAGPASAVKDITALYSTAPTFGSEDSGWPASNVTDGQVTSKWYAGIGVSHSWLRQEAEAGVVVTYYTLTSANDYPERDPKDWTLEGSNDDFHTFVVLDQQQGQRFPRRYQTRTFAAQQNPGALPFASYRLSITANNGPAADLQLAEWRLYGRSGRALTAPDAPQSLLATPLSSDQIQLTFARPTGRLHPASAIQVERATDSQFTRDLVTRTVGPARDADAGPIFDHRALNLNPGTDYYFRVKALNSAGASAVSNTAYAKTGNNPLPTTFSSSNGWYPTGHGEGQPIPDETFTKIFSDASVTVYRDSKATRPVGAGSAPIVASDVSWLTPSLSEAWSYIKSQYPMYSGPQLSVVLGSQPDNPAASVTYAWSDKNAYRNLVFSFNADWSTRNFSTWPFQSLMHELNHIVESNNNEMQDSPSYAVWGDSHWGEIFMYDLYKHLASVPSTGVAISDAEALRLSWWEARDTVGSRWLQDWYWPLYNGTLGNTAAGHSGAAFLRKYFELLAQNYDRIASEYTHSMNLGEYVHFCSAAAGVDLTNAARSAFHFERRPLAEAQLAQAQLDYPAVSALYLANRAPGFVLDPIARSAPVGSALSGQTLAGSAGDPDPAATLSYSKVSGPSWLTVSADGALSGTPPTAGAFSVVVRVTDNGALSDTATLNLTATGGACTPETDAAFCARLAATCGTLTGVDNCGAARSATCGSCTAPQTCGGGGTANVCGGTSQGSTPCSGLCTSPVVFAGNNYNSGALGLSATCHETTANLQGANCSNFTGRTFKINATTLSCNGQNVSLPAKRNGGYCFQASAGSPAWSSFATF